MSQTQSKPPQKQICHSPCTALREKYLEVIAKDKNLEADLIALEKRAQTAAEEAKTGKQVTENVIKKAGQQDLKADVLALDIKQKELTDLAKDLDKRLKD